MLCSLASSRLDRIGPNARHASFFVRFRRWRNFFLGASRVESRWLRINMFPQSSSLGMASILKRFILTATFLLYVCTNLSTVCFYLTFFNITCITLPLAGNCWI